MPRFREIAPNLFLWTDTCNVYVLRDGEHALLIDLGDGSVLDHLGEIGVRQVEWVLFTHHHREQCQGGAKLAGTSAKTACSETEKPLFEQPLSFRKMRPTLGDRYSVYGASYVRPPRDAISIDRTFYRMDDFTWRGREFRCIETKGNSPGHMAYLLEVDGHWLAFSGDLMLAGGKMHTWFDTEWDYGFADGIYALGESAAQVAGYSPALLLPSHGEIVPDARGPLEEYVAKLRKLAALYVRGYDIRRFAGCDQDNISRPTKVPHLWEVSPHLFKFRGPNCWVNFGMILDDSGHALLVDCGLFKRDFLDTAIARMKQRLGLKQIDAVFVTHMHGDHGMEAGYIREKYGAELWTMEGVADKFERSWDYDLAALLPAYQDPGKNLGLLNFDRVLTDGETIRWRDYVFVCDWMPGQTKYHACLHGAIDGRHVAFTGDNICAGTDDPNHGGNEAVVARNGGALEEGYLYAAEYLHNIAPDLIIGGHCWAIDQPAELIERMRDRMLALRDAFQDLSVPDDYREMFDPYQVQAVPYRTIVQPGGTAGLRIAIRNYRQQPQEYRIVLRAPAGLSVDPPVLTGSIGPEATVTIPVDVRAAASAKPGLQTVTMDITRDSVRQGELFDLLVHVGDVPGEPDSAEPARKGDKKGGY